RPGRPVPLPLPKPIPIPLPVVPVAAPAAHLAPPVPSQSSSHQEPAPKAAPKPTPKPTAAQPALTPAPAAHPFVGIDPYVPPERPAIENPVALATEKYQQGRARFEKRDFHAAAFLLREAAKLDPSRAEHHYTLARTLTVLSQARHVHDGHEGCHVTCNLGGALIRNQKVRYEAVQHYREAAHLDPQNAAVRIELGQLYKIAGMGKKAEACFWEALLLDAKNETAMKELGLDGNVEVPKSENPLAQKP